jgi:hypothetical protein
MYPRFRIKKRIHQSGQTLLDPEYTKISSGKKPSHISKHCFLAPQ